MAVFFWRDNKPEKPVIWRDSNDYRGKYFKRNPGLFGFLYFCSQCGRPLFGKDEVEVDHVYAPSRQATKVYDKDDNLVSNTGFFAEALNTTSNCVAICRSCNAKKKDKAGIYLVKGLIAKGVEVTVFTAQKVMLMLLILAIKFIHFIFRSAIEILSKPLKDRSNKWYVKLVYAGCLAAVVIGLIGKLFGDVNYVFRWLTH